MEKQFIDKVALLEQLYQALTQCPNSFIDGLETAIEIVSDMPVEAWFTDGTKPVS